MRILVAPDYRSDDGVSSEEVPSRLDHSIIKRSQRGDYVVEYTLRMSYLLALEDMKGGRFIASRASKPLMRFNRP